MGSFFETKKCPNFVKWSSSCAKLSAMLSYVTKIHESINNPAVWSTHVTWTRQLWITTSVCLCFDWKKKRILKKTSSLTLQIAELYSPGLRLRLQFHSFKPYLTFLKCAFHVGSEHSLRILLFKLNGTKYTPTNKEFKTWDRKREGVGYDFSSLETTFKTRNVSFGIVISFSTFQTHIKVLQLYFRLQDHFYTHHWFCHFF